MTTLTLSGPDDALRAAASVWTGLDGVRARVPVSLPAALSSTEDWPDGEPAALATLCLLRAITAAVPAVTATVEGAPIASLGAPPPWLVRGGSLCRPRRDAPPSPDAHRDQALVAAAKAAWPSLSGALGLDDATPTVQPPPTGLTLRADATSITLHNGTGGALRDVRLVLLGWDGATLRDHRQLPARALAAGHSATWPLVAAPGSTWTAQATAQRVLQRDAGVAAAAAVEGGALVRVPVPADLDEPVRLEVAVTNAAGQLLGAATTTRPPAPGLPCAVMVPLAAPSAAAAASWSWASVRPVSAGPIPLPAASQGDPQRLALPPVPTAPVAPAPQSVAPPPPVSAPASRPAVARTAAPPPAASATDRYARAEVEPWDAVSALFPLNSLDMAGRDRVRAMLQSNRVDAIVAACNISRTTGWKTTVQTMRRLVNHDHPRVRIAAAAGIGALAGPAMEHLLVRLVDHDADPEVRQAAQAALSDLRSR